MTFVRTAWYVAALADLVTRDSPLRRVMLGEPVVAYRGESGTAVVLADRCPHRFAPLSKGKVKGDCIECPYHGLTFEPGGTCVFNPHGDGKIPAAAKVRSYPVVERDGIVWAWTGDPGCADATKVPDYSALYEHGLQSVIGGDFLVNAHYELVIDNLMDLSHALFLHPTTLADPESAANLRFEMKQDGDTVWAYHYVPNSKPSAQFAPFRQSTEPLCDAHAHMRWEPPANLFLDVGVTECGRPDVEGVYARGVHLLTPIDETHTRYTWIAARNFLTGNVEVSALMKQQIEHAFVTEDEPMIHAVADNMGTTELFALKPALLPGDRAAVRVRRVLKTLREREACPAS